MFRHAWRVSGRAKTHGQGCLTPKPETLMTATLSFHFIHSLTHSFIHVFIGPLLCVRHCSGDLGHSSEPEKSLYPPRASVILEGGRQINKHVSTDNKENKAELGDRKRQG